MEEIGVMAVVEGLSSFVSGMDTIKSSIESIKPPASILQDAFGALGEAAGNFASWVGDVLTYTLGHLLADAIETIVAGIRDMISATIEAGNEFQTLELRLRNINLDALMKSGEGYNAATRESIDLTRQQLSWLQKLAMATPYDNTDISQVYSLARSYGFADKESRKLTEDVSDFASSMGLSGDRLEGIIKQFGTMTQRGKITGTAMRSLAQGSFMPLDDILDRMSSKMGITTKALTKLISTPQGIPADLFIAAFQEMVAEEPRFSGASEKMARTFIASTNNVKDLVTSIGGLNIVTPVLNVLGGKVADFMDQFVKSGPAGQEFTALGQRLIDAAVKIGDVFSKIISDVFGLLPSSDALAESLVGGLENLAAWLENNEGTIIAKIREVWTWLMSLGQSDFVTGLLNQLQSLYNQLFNVMNAGDIPGWQMLKFAILDVAAAIGGVLSSVLNTLGLNSLPTMSFQVKDVVFALLQLSTWIRDNQELLTNLIIIIGAFIIIQTITSLVWGLLMSLMAIIGGIVAVAAAVGALTILFIGIAAAVSFVMTTIEIFNIAMMVSAGVVQVATDLIMGYFTNMENTFQSIITRIDTAWRNNDWFGIGAAIINGISDGIMRNVDLLISTAVDAATSAYTAAANALGIHSPSTMFAGIGENLMLGMAQGISASAGVAVSAMQNAVAAVSVPAMAAPSVMAQYTSAPSAISNTYQQTNNNNLTINSQAQTEQVAASFAMMQSLAGI